MTQAPDHVHVALRQLAQGQPLSRTQMRDFMSRILTGEMEPAQMAAFLTFYAQRLPTVDELVGAISIMREHATMIAHPHDKAIDTCGTGGVHSNLMNISTASAIVAAAAGAKVCKHGNRAVTSRSGSSDALAALGVNINTTPEQEARCLNDIGLCFAFAPRHHPGMKHVAPIRQALGFPSIFNMVGPLVNPGAVKRQLLGVRSPEVARLLVEVLRQSGSVRAWVISGQDPKMGRLCEVSITGPTHVSMLDQGHVTEFEMKPAAPYVATDLQSLTVESPSQSAALIYQVLSGASGVPRAMIITNAAAALWVAEVAKDYAEGLTLATQALDSGQARKVLEQLIKLSHQV
jgi:anthranilate phosphoribosyltransferase